MKLETTNDKSVGKSDGVKVSNLETSAWQRRSIARSNSGVESKPRRSNAICFVTVEGGKSYNTISFVKLKSSKTYRSTGHKDIFKNTLNQNSELIRTEIFYQYLF